MGHALEYQTTDESLRGLYFQQAGREFVAKDGFQAEHDGFCQRANMVASIFLPLWSSVLANVTQVLIALEAFGLPIEKQSPGYE